MNVLLLTSHAIAEFDDLRMLTDLGFDVFSIGGAYGEVPFEGKRPALPKASRHPDLEAACDRQRAAMTDLWGDPGRGIDWAKAQLHDDVIDWADVIIVHHFPESWIAGQWDRIKGKRVIWRTCGQSSPDGSLERLMAPLAGLQIVRYSPRERSLPDFAGENALIRFGKYPDDYGPWVGDGLHVGNVTQHMAQRGDACGFGFWSWATEGLPVQPAGPGSEALRGGIGELSYPAMLDYLRHLRTYLYTGTRPASYTLGLMEAMLSGVPVISIGREAFGLGDLFEPFTDTYDDPRLAGQALNVLLSHQDKAEAVSRATRAQAIDLFGIETVGAQWKAFLS